MTIKTFKILSFALFFPLILFSQESNTNNSKIELLSGEIVEGILPAFGVEGASGKQKIRVYDSNKKLKRKISLTEISKLTYRLNESMIQRHKNDTTKLSEDELTMHFKVLYSPEKKIPRLCKYFYIGENYEFYKFNKLKEKAHIRQMFITKSNSNIIEYNYAIKNAKKDLKNLSEYFKTCNKLVQESEKKDANKDIIYFLKLADECKD